MKFSLFFAVASTAGASPLIQASSNLKDIARRQAPPQDKLPGDTPGGAFCQGPGGRVADVPGHQPLRQELESQSPGVKRVKLLHGPYQVPNMMVKSIMGEGGALWNCADDKIDKPCEECAITGIQAGLEYPNGTNANIDSGMWLHHMVLATVGPGRWDPTCVNSKESLPHFAMGTTPNHSERSFASGNERTKGDLTKWASQAGKKAAYQLNKADRFRVIVDLMNMSMQDVVVYLTMTYEYLDGKLPADYLDVKPIWLDADQCRMSEIHPPQDNGTFSISAKPWSPNFEGEMILIGGHLHDGGTNAQILVNNAPVCDSIAKYAEQPEYVFKGATTMTTGEKFAEKHISSMNTCYFKDQNAKKLNKDAPWSLKALYDYEKYPGNREADGEQADIMAIAIAYAAIPQGGVPIPAA